jgi:proteasome assembly chaperone (PAC2) family protein
MPDGYTPHDRFPTLDSPVLIGMLNGWIDASGAAAGALAAIDAECEARPLVTFDGDLFIDYRARRPTMELREGLNTRLVWPEIVLKAGRSVDGSDVLLLGGAEPDSNWHRFADTATGLAIELGARMVVFLGAYPFACPHTRPSRLSCSSPSAELLATVPFLKSSVDVPAGMGAVLEHAFVAKGIPAIGLWAQVPHYLGTMHYPAASLALLDGLAQMTGITVEATPLRDEAQAMRQRIDQLVGANDEHQAMVTQMESLYDASAGEAGGAMPGTLGGFGSADLPSADELAAEVELFLREQGD